MERRVGMIRKTIGAAVLGAAILALGFSAVASAREAPPPTWEGLKRADRPGLDAVYLREGASLARYKKVMLDPVEVSFDKNWKPNPAGSVLTTIGRVDTQQIRKNLADLARQVTKRELERKNGFPLVETAGPDVLRVRAQIVDLFINAPDTKTPGVKSYVISAGEMTLVADLYDSETNTLIGHVIDREKAIENGPYEFQIANSVTNAVEADRILSGWARRLRSALENAR